MSFIHIAFALAGLLLMLVPLILHLLQRRQRKLVELSTFRFLFETYFREGRAMKILEYLLLALRMLALLALGLFFARPLLAPLGFFGWGNSPRAIVLILDSSASMSATEGGISRLDLARDLAREFIARCRPEDELSLINAHNDAEVLAAHVRGDLPLVAAKLDSIRPTARTGRLGPGLSQAAAILKETPLNRKEIYFLSDLQKSTWDQYTHETEQALLERDMALCLVQLGDGQTANAALLPDATPRVRPSIHIPIDLRVLLANFGAERRDILLTVTLADKGKENDPPLRRELMTLEPGEQRPVNVLHTFEEPGCHAVDFQISGDAFPLDDHSTMTVQVAPVANVLLVTGKRGKAIYEDATFYLSRALQPDPKIQDSRKILVQQVTCEPAQIQAGMLAGRDVVVLAEVPALTLTALTCLKGFVAAGGGLLVFPGESADTNFYNGACGGSNDLFGALLPAPLVRTFSGESDPQRFTYLAGIDFQHPVFALFRGEHAAALALPRFYSIWELGALAPRARRLSAFSIGLDAILENRYGGGKVLMASFPAQLGWSSFPLKPAFVPFVHQSVAYLCPGKWGDSLHDQEIDDMFRLYLPPALRRSEIGLVTPGGQRGRIPLLAQGEGYEAATNLTESGKYQVDLKLADGRVETGWFTARTAVRESMFEPVPEEEARRLIPNARVNLVKTGNDIIKSADQLVAGKPLWRLVAWLAILVLVAEFLVGNRAFLPWSGGKKKIHEP